MRRIDQVKKMLSVLLCLLMLVQTVPMASLAAQYDQDVLEAVTEQIAPNPGLPENVELFAVYAEQMLYGYEVATFGNTAGDQLTGDEKLAYDALKLVAAQIAAGERASTSVSLGYGTYNVNVGGTIESWTPEITVNFTELTTSFDLKAVVSALLSDCPFEMYWYDKTIGCKITTLQTEKLCYIEFHFHVAGAYSSGTYMADTAKTAAAATATANANAVVDANKDKTPYERLVAYKDYICQATSYNYAAADNDNTPYGDPWQLIYVFDGNPATTVVCEGYAKALQYLCDLDAQLEADDKDDILCVCASGIMGDGTDEGGHMWNVVTLDGKNYLVDVTNCDEGTVGAPDQLFLVGGKYKNGGYSYALSQTITYTCEDLNLAGEKYIASAPGCAEHTADEAIGQTCKGFYCSVCESWYGEPNPDAHTFVDGKCILCGLLQVEVVFINDHTIISHTVNGRTVTVNYDKPCRAGYWDGAQYIAMTAVENEDDSYSISAPAGVTEVLIVIVGDTNADGRVTASDLARLNAHLKNKTNLTEEELFAADVNYDGRLTDTDKRNMNNAILGKTPLVWEIG